MNKNFIYVENWTKVDPFFTFPKHLWYLDYTPIEPIQLIQHYKCTKKAFKTAEETQTAGSWAARQVAGGVGGSLLGRPVAV